LSFEATWPIIRSLAAINAGKKQVDKLQSPSKIQKHGPAANNTGKSSSKKKHRDAKKRPSSKDEVSSNNEIG